MTADQIVDRYFLEHRAKVLDVAAYLDRLDRAPDAGEARDDFRTGALRRAIAVLIDGRPERARRVLELLSDPSSEPIPVAGTRGALGAHDPRGGAA